MNPSMILLGLGRVLLLQPTFRQGYRETRGQACRRVLDFFQFLLGVDGLARGE